MTLGFDKERLKVALGEARSAIDELTRNHGAELQKSLGNKATEVPRDNKNTTRKDTQQ